MGWPWEKDKSGDSVESIQADIERLEAEAKRKDLELTVAQKNMMLARLKSQGVDAKSFGGSWTAIRNWLRQRGLW